jgi:hypothetical protein
LSLLAGSALAVARKQTLARTADRRHAPTRLMEDAMALVIKIVATVLILIGIVWFLQGINVLPGSFMTGDMKWAVIGAASVVVGVGAWLYAGRRRRPPAA